MIRIRRSGADGAAFFVLRGCHRLNASSIKGCCFFSIFDSSGVVGLMGVDCLLLIFDPAGGQEVSGMDG